MRSFQLKIGDREQGRYDETQIGQMLADGRVNRHTLCKVARGSEWETVDDYLPMLKCGTQLPEPTRTAAGDSGRLNGSVD
jgi:hypothetical protein